MKKLTIKNIGAIKSVELDLNRINVFIGPQSSGKSTISKILCHCMWVEKHCYLNNDEREKYASEDVLYRSLIEYHRLDGYFNKTASFKYVGDLMTISYTHSTKKVKITENKNGVFPYPKIAYIPSERNLVATISNFEKYNESNDVITYFGYDWTDAKESLSKINLSSILDKDIKYENKNGIDYIKDGKGEIFLKYSSSGVLSLLPMYMSIMYLYDIIYAKENPKSPMQRKIIWEKTEMLTDMANTFNHSLTLYEKHCAELLHLAKILGLQVLPLNKYLEVNSKETQKSIFDLAIEVNNNIERLFDYKYTQLFVEEPEQNLFPNAQMKFVDELFTQLNNREKRHSAVVNTHSPFVIFAINNCIMRHIVKNNISDEMKSKLLDNKATIDPKDISIYQVEDGELKKIQDEDGNLDENFINDAYKANSAEYFSLLNFYEDEE